jgi:site-specific DNA-methyltransferase (adenine-specific)
MASEPAEPTTRQDPKPYFEDASVTLYHGDMREILPALDVRADACITDPPYGETSLAWDRWPDGWVNALGDVTNALWCFGSMRMILDRRDEFAGWRLSQDVVWLKDNASGFQADRFRRVHEHVLYWYRGPWASAHQAVPRVRYDGPYRGVNRQGRRGADHLNSVADDGTWVDDGTRLIGSVLKANRVRGGLHPTEKPQSILDPLIRYSVPPGGLVLDPFAGSGSTLLTARSLGRRAVGIEADERYCEAAARRLSEPDLFTEAS